jgi:hypothetical protein
VSRRAQYILLRDSDTEIISVTQRVLRCNLSRAHDDVFGPVRRRRRAEGSDIGRILAYALQFAGVPFIHAYHRGRHYVPRFYLHRTAFPWYVRTSNSQRNPTRLCIQATESACLRSKACAGFSRPSRWMSSCSTPPGSLPSLAKTPGRAPRPFRRSSSRTGRCWG